MSAPPLLLIDAGNSRLKWATAAGRARILLRGESSTREIDAAAVRKLARQFPGHYAVLACVVPRLVPLFKSAFKKRLHVVTGGSPALKLFFRYPKPGELGADRLAAAVAAQAEGIWPVIIVSCGTAAAFTVLNARGELCGGVIAPGLHTQLAALLGATAQLPATPLHAPRRLPALSTQEAIRAGVLLSFQGGVREIVARLSQALPGRTAPRILLTGGDAHQLRGVLGAKAKVRSLLVMEGLRMIGIRLSTSL